jgi:hypothetical protein
MLGRGRGACPERGPRRRHGRKALRHLGERRIGCRGRHLFLPEIEEAPRQGGRIFAAVVHASDPVRKRRLRPEGFAGTIQP